MEDDDYLTAAPPRPAHLWLLGLEGRTARRLTTGSWSLATSLGASPISWFPDGSAIAITRFSSAHSGDTDQRTVQVVDVETGRLRALTKRAGRESSPAVSPDGPGSPTAILGTAIRPT